MNNTTTAAVTTTSNDFEDEMIVSLCAENDEGNIEYKRMLIDPSPLRFQHLVTQLKFRLDEGQGEALYQIGVDDDGTVAGIPLNQLDSSLSTLQRMAKELKAETSLVSKRIVKSNMYVCEMLVRYSLPLYLPHSSSSTTTAAAASSMSNCNNNNSNSSNNNNDNADSNEMLEEMLLDLRITVAGNVDSGKSTLIGVLTRGALDNGRGSARSNVFRHRHEASTGRTSSISHQIMGFDAKGSCVNTRLGHLHTITWPDIVKESVKILTFVDLCGHEKYLKTTCQGLSSHPDYTMLMIGGNMGVTKMSKEHLGLAVALKIPVFVCITKIDIAPVHVLNETLETICKILKSPGAKKMPIVIRGENADEDDEGIVTAAKNISNVTPIFLISSVTGAGLTSLHKFLNILPARKQWNLYASQPAEFMIDDHFFITGVGTVVSGTLLKGTVQTNDTLLLGPDSTGAFIPAQVKSIHSKRVAVRKVAAGASAAFGLKKIKRNQIHKGMVLVNQSLNPKAVIEFTAEVLILHHPTTIQVNYQPVLHINQIRQSAKIITMDHQLLRSGDRAMVRFHFMYRPEFLQIGDRFVFRENRTKGIGIIRELHFDAGL